MGNDLGGRRPSYAVLWREPDGVVCSGALQLGPERLRLGGNCRDGRSREHEIAYGDVTSTRIGRAPGERIDGRSTLILEAGGATLLITSAVGLGMIHEMAERLEGLTARSTTA
jgi:hypothetical protein